MKLTVLGNTGPYPAYGGACSGYLLEEGNTRIILDLGSGCLANLRDVCRFDEITAIVVSHHHADHVSDLYVMQYALELKGLTVPVYAPPEPATEFQRLSACACYDVIPIAEGMELTIGKLGMTFGEMSHPSQNFATKISDGKRAFVYTGDTCRCDALVPFLKGTWTVLCDCAFLEDIHSDKHLSVYEACQVANESEIRHLIMTHFSPDVRVEKYLQMANDRFKGRVSCAGILTKFSL